MSGAVRHYRILCEIGGGAWFSGGSQVRNGSNAPDLQAAILEGRQPPTLTLQSLIAADLPPAWPDQRAWVAALA